MKKASPRVVVVGSSNTDLVLSCDRLPRPGETLLGGEFQRFQGGKGANQAVAAARAGARVIFIGARGGDDFGRASAEALRREGISLTHFRTVSSAPSGVALILMGGRGRENMIGVARSANDLVSPADIDRARLAISRPHVILTQLEVPLPAVIRAAELAERFDVPFILNPAPARKLPSALLRRVHLLIPNEPEAMLLSGQKTPEASALALLRRGPKHVVVTLGPKGALLANAEGIQYFPAPRVKSLDTVGAGDCFCGWLAVGLAERLSLEVAISRAIKAAAIAVTRPGAQSGMPRRDEI